MMKLVFAVVMGAVVGLCTSASGFTLGGSVVSMQNSRLIQIQDAE